MFRNKLYEQDVTDILFNVYEKFMFHQNVTDMFEQNVTDILNKLYEQNVTDILNKIIHC